MLLTSDQPIHGWISIQRMGRPVSSRSFHALPGGPFPVEMPGVDGDVVARRSQPTGQALGHERTSPT